MVLRFLKPNKYNLPLFAILTILLFYLPIVPTLITPVVLEPISTWNLNSPAQSLQNIQIVGVSEMYFGTFTGGDAFLVSISATLMIAYLLSSIVIYFVRKEIN